LKRAFSTQVYSVILDYQNRNDHSGKFEQKRQTMGSQPTQIKDWSQMFATYRGQWVAFADDEVTVLASGPTAKAALAASIANGAADPILYRVPENLDTFVGHEVFL
jgi:hypothetical protein